jgi:hypothetical protein
MINGWVIHDNGDIWDSPNPRTARPVAYKVKDGGPQERKYMVSGARTAKELLAIVTAMDDSDVILERRKEKQ